MLLCLASATHNYKWVENTAIGLPWDQTFANLGSLNTHFLPIAIDLIGWKGGPRMIIVVRTDNKGFVATSYFYVSQW